jgi:hypothetical protein
LPLDLIDQAQYPSVWVPRAVNIIPLLENLYQPKVWIVQILGGKNDSLSRVLACRFLGGRGIAGKLPDTV